MKIAEKVISNLGRAIPKIALSLGLNTSEQACIWWFHQPKVPAKWVNVKKNNQK